MKSRCYNSNYKQYKDYGGRGIKICDEWKNDFMNFYNWSISNGYSNDLTIDRTDNNKNYEPSNCIWNTRLKQNRNTRKNHYIAHNGITKCISEWASIYNLKPQILDSRLKLGWDFEKAISTPVRKHNN